MTHDLTHLCIIYQSKYIIHSLYIYIYIYIFTICHTIDIGASKKYLQSRLFYLIFRAQQPTEQFFIL